MNQYKRVWTKSAVRNELLRLYKNGHDLRQKTLTKTHSGLVHAVLRHYGSWPGAFMELGIPLNYKTRNTWDKEKVIDEIRCRVKENKSIQHKKVEKENGSLVHAGRVYFGSWEKAVEAAGYDYNEIRLTQHWTKEKVLKEIRKLDAEGQDLNCKRNKAENSKLYWVAVDRFGSWEKAVIRAGINYEKHRCHKVWSKARIFDAIKSRVEQGKKINSRAVFLDDNRLYQAGEGYFGTWTEAVRASGVQPHTPRQATSVKTDSGRLNSTASQGISDKDYFHADFI